MNTVQDMIATSNHLRAMYTMPAQIGMCDRSWINTAILEGLEGRTEITPKEAVAMVRGILAKEYPGRNVMGAWHRLSYAGAGKEAGQVAIIVGCDATIYNFPQGWSIIATPAK